MSGKTVGEALVSELQERGVRCVFGIPGVHTIELYRGLARSGIRHVTPRHEQGAGFMADGYARASGEPGVAFVITGPGLTNTLTAMAQARADSIPILVVSGVNATSTLGKAHGHLHELPDQLALVRTVALESEEVSEPGALPSALDRVFGPFSRSRPGPTHIQIPLDIAGQPAVQNTVSPPPDTQQSIPEPQAIGRAVELLASAQRIVILAGGGAKTSEVELQALAERLDAPVVQTVNARGILYQHPLAVPASPSLRAIRDLIETADCVLALGTELGPTDYDMYSTGKTAALQNLIRVDVCSDQLARHPCEVAIQATVATATETLLAALPGISNRDGGEDRAAKARTASKSEIGSEYRDQVAVLEAIRNAVPHALMVGDSTQPIYAGNLYYDHDHPGGWFNAATGYGALGYGIPAAIGAAIAAPESPIICIVGDGGAQFSLPEIMTAVDENLPITFLVWNNQGYGEIATSMEAVDIEVIGCDPSPPDFAAMAQGFGIPYYKVSQAPETVSHAVREAQGNKTPAIVEVAADLQTPK